MGGPKVFKASAAVEGVGTWFAKQYSNNLTVRSCGIGFDTLFTKWQPFFAEAVFGVSYILIKEAYEDHACSLTG
jgi:hypothetical protein